MDTDDTMLLAGIKIVPNFKLLKQFEAYEETFPQGDFFTIDISNNPATSNLDFGVFPTFGDFDIFGNLETLSDIPRLSSILPGSSVLL